MNMQTEDIIRLRSNNNQTNKPTKPTTNKFCLWGKLIKLYKQITTRTRK